MKEAIIVDIDGTLAKMQGRSPYDWSKVSKDKVNEPIKTLVNSMSQLGYIIIVVSGRDGSCEEETTKWLDKNDIDCDFLFIREKGNNEKDTIIKKRFLDKIKKKFRILFVLDDRDQVVKMWREEGLTCLQVGYGNF